MSPLLWPAKAYTLGAGADAALNMTRVRGHGVST